MDEQSTVTLNVAQAARRAGVSSKTIYRAIEDGRLKAAVLGRTGALRVRPEWIDEWIEGNIYVPKRRPAAAVFGTYSAGAERHQPRRGFLQV